VATRCADWRSAIPSCCPNIGRPPAAFKRITPVRGSASTHARPTTSSFRKLWKWHDLFLLLAVQDHAGEPHLLHSSGLGAMGFPASRLRAVRRALVLAGVPRLRRWGQGAFQSTFMNSDLVARLKLSADQFFVLAMTAIVDSCVQTGFFGAPRSRCYRATARSAAHLSNCGRPNALQPSLSKIQSDLAGSWFAGSHRSWPRCLATMRYDLRV